jgi:hypothetical protein
MKRMILNLPSEMSLSPICHGLASATHTTCLESNLYTLTSMRVRRGGERGRTIPTGRPGARSSA